MKCPYKIHRVIKKVTKETSCICEEFGECDEEKCFFYDEYADKPACKRVETETGGML